MKVSIIMAVKNEASYLKPCLESIVSQDYHDWELLVTDDFSSDETLEILKEFEKRDPRVMVESATSGTLIPTLRESYERRSGELVTRMDADDLMPEGKLKTLVSEWLTYGEGHIVSGAVRHFKAEGPIGNGFKRYDEWLLNVAKTNRHLENLYKECVIPSNAWIMHRLDFEKAGAFNSDNYPEDYDLCFRFFKAKLKVVGIPKILHLWRDRPDRISRSRKEYEDNRYFDLKLQYFKQLHYDNKRPLFLWGAGRNGKQLAQKLRQYSIPFRWTCNTQTKQGKKIYDTVIEPISALYTSNNPQAFIAVASPKDQTLIRKNLDTNNLKEGYNYWFVV